MTLPALLLLLGCRPAPNPTSPLPVAPDDTAHDSAPPAPDTADTDAEDDTGEAEAPPEQLLLNPSFEDGTAALPDHWLPYGDGSYARDETDSAEGAQHVALGGAPFALLYQRVPATPGQRYIASSQLRSASGTGDATLKLEFHDAAERKLVEEVWALSAPRSWTRATLAAVAPAEAATVTLALVGSGDVPCRFDDATLATAPRDTLILDLEDTAQVFEGFGAQIWGYASNQPVLETGLRGLRIRHVRVENVWEQATEAQLAQTWALTSALGVSWLSMAWAEPGGFSTGGRLTDPAGFAAWWAAEVAAMDAAGRRPYAIELMNEPDSGGAWSTGIDPDTYATLVGATRTALDARGLSSVGIVGPGTAAFDWGSGARNYALALADAGADTALLAWSAHAWDDDGSCGGACLERAARDLTHAATLDRPLWVTEVATKATRFGGATWPLPDEDGTFNATYAPGYAVRVYANILAVLNAGASVPFLWQLMDEPTEVLGKDKGWGLLGLDGTPRPAYLALEALAAALPQGGLVLRAPPQEGLPLYGAAVASAATVAVALANDSDAEVTQGVRLEGARRALRLTSATAFVQTDPGDPAARRPGAGEVRTAEDWITDAAAGGWQVTLPARSTLVLTLAR